ncbi:MAG TPA: pyridoxamine 5'-phosphate oxidase family protein [Chloroflexota bacterium]|nr:pyridoxamine 5'-phosphate oxidase family protein [Chloroflexota bacterium]
MSSRAAVTWDARAAALDILREQRVAVIATVDGDQPWASTVYYAADGFVLYVNTPNGTTMLHNITQNSCVGYAIDERRPTFFLQAIGRAAIVDDSEEFVHARALLAVKVPEAHVGAPGYTLVKIESTVVYVSDFRQGYRPRAEVII